MHNIIRVLVAGIDSLVGVAIRATLIAEKDLIIVGEANDTHKVRELERKLKPNLLIIDFDSPNFTPPEPVFYLHKSCPNLKMLALANCGEIDLSILRAGGIVGCVLKSEKPQTLVSAIRTVAKGNTWYSPSVLDELVAQEVNELNQDGKATLTEREQQVLSMIAQGWDNIRIACELNLGHQTVRNYISRIYAKLAVNSRAEAVVWAMEHGPKSFRKVLEPR
ncbi:LuxR C-terminal-related transcriptional regulator [aff. Roholtiella sp. LEGE 12411]|uniref:LuxR C-terminal-related transcriptional regulator n=1 Tax=aff. Roholtiella sp. LEGE 12411 TaxID=1828822 RepID=UPI001880C7A5|nr:response regulator transcription factor [aff. Roholtiella sp. LEGE 12411]MBE9035900.1 response regulator transcription factor [aff. Roholtiella sp. LEGE 12411]